MRGGVQRHAFLALGRLPVGAMNKTEAAYERDLRDAQTLGDILWYRFEGLKLRLADNTFYTPDFIVLASDGVLECHEVKGFWADGTVWTFSRREAATLGQPRWAHIA
jgi:hypothetical protein